MKGGISLFDLWCLAVMRAGAGQRRVGVVMRVLLRAFGFHLLGGLLPSLILWTALLLPLAYAWTNLVLASFWTKTVYAETDSGRVAGFTQDKVNYFLGIRYAAPPVRDLRWRSPRPTKKWSKKKPYDATFFKAECMQGKLHNPDRPKVMSEDCLFLNVWSPTWARKSRPIPVMVWLYGGAFQQGGSSKVEYYGENLALKGVVVVSCNYRLGTLGFLVSVEDGLYGNYGIQDQRYCLEWVQRNIRNFGGDPTSVTLFGESAGAMAVGQHLLMDGAGRLFHRVIMQSNPFSYHYRGLTVANFLGQAVKRGVDCYDLKCMQEEPVDELLELQDSLHGMPRSVGDLFTWGPVVREGPYRRRAERVLRDELPITIRQPLKALESPSFVNNVPVILGSCKDEGHMFVYNAFPFPMPKYLYWTFVAVLFRDSATKVVRFYRDIANHYTKNVTRPDYRPVLSTILNDYMFRCPTWRAAHLLQEKSRPGVPVYVFQFSQPTRVPGGYPECTGLSCHTSELPYVFNNLEVIHKSYAMNTNTSRSKWTEIIYDLFLNTDGDERLADLMSTFWTDFAKTSDPNAGGGKVRWPQWKGRRRYHSKPNPVEGKGGRGKMTVDEPHYLELKWKPEIHLATRDCTCDFWDKIGYRF